MRRASIIVAPSAHSTCICFSRMGLTILEFMNCIMSEKKRMATLDVERMVRAR